MFKYIVRKLYYGIVTLTLTTYFVNSDTKLIPESQIQEQTVPQIEQLLDFERKLYDRKVKVKREINLKTIKLCQSIAPENQCQETDNVQRNSTIYVLAYFDLVGLRNRELIKELRLHYEHGEKTLESEGVTLSLETETFPQEKGLQTSVSAFIDNGKLLGKGSLEFILKDTKSGTSVSLAKRIELKEESY